MRGFWAAFLLFAALLAPVYADAPIHRDPLIVETAAGPVSIQIELAVTEQERARGLMFRRALADNAGMLFDFGADESVSMWMKNTYIPLDMVFIASDGTIRRIEDNTVPFSLDTIASGTPVRYVLELAGGAARRLGIRQGDKVSHQVISAP